MRRRTRTLLLFAAAIGVLVFYVAGASGTLSGGSTFSAENGKLDPTSPAVHDWNHPVDPISCPSTAPGAGTNCGLDLVKNSSDDALGQGSKEDQTSVTLVDGSIPPSKDDLSRFYINHEKVGSTDFLYLAWERSNLLGSAHLDFELNKKPVGFTSQTPAGAITLNRTDGDKLIDFDFSGSGSPVLAIRTWTTTGSNASSDCEASNTYPCWSKGTTLQAGVAESSVNCSPVTDNNAPNAPFSVDGNSKNGCNSEFGEAGINLQAAGIFPSGGGSSGSGCTSFADAWLKSRSSGNSFGSELKDIVAPIPTSISNCGTIVIKKRTVPRGVNKDFTLQNVDVPTSGTTFSHTLDANGQFTLNDNGNTGTNDSTGNTQTITNVLAGTYHVKEIVPATGWDLTGITCDNGGGQDQVDPTKADIPVTVGGTTTCIFTNTQRGSIKVVKETDPAGGTGFTFTGDAHGTIDDGGNITVTNLAAGTYTSTESAKTGWDLTKITCDDGSSATPSTTSLATKTATFKLDPGENITCTFHNVQRGTIIVKKVTDPSGGTGFTFTGDAAGTINDGGTITTLSLVPGQYTSTESAKTGWDLTSISCDDGSSKTPSTTSLATSTATFNLDPGETVTCTFNNKQKFGALQITKQSVKSGHAGLAGAKFHVTGPGGYDQTWTSGVGGTVCFDGLLSGSYSVTETDAPTGYTIDDTTAHTVPVSATGAKCGDATGVATFTASDTPKTNLTITVASQDTGPGGSNSTIQCTLDSDSSDIGNSPKGPSNSATVTANDLAPGNYTCKVNIDP